MGVLTWLRSLWRWVVGVVMPLSSQPLHVPFVGGIQQHIDPKHLQIGALTRLENGRATKAGAIEKRYGNTDIGTVTGVQRLLGHGSELLAIDGTNILAYSPTQNTWVTKDKVPEATCVTQPFPSGANGVGGMDVAINGNLAMVVWRTNISGLSFGDVFASVIDLSSGAQLISGQLLASTIGYSPRVVAYGGGWIILYGDVTAGKIWARTYSAGGSISSATALRTDISPGGALPFDVCVLSDGFCLAYGDAFGPSTVKLVKYNGSLAQQAIVTPTGSLPHNCVAVDATGGERIWLALGTTRIKVATYNVSTLAETLAPTNIGADFGQTIAEVGIVRTSSTTAGVVYSVSDTGGATGKYALCAPVVNTSGAAVSGATETNRTTYHCRLSSKPFVRSGKVYAVVLTGVQTQLSTTLVDLGQDDTTTTALLVRPVARGPRRTGAMQSGGGAGTTESRCSVAAYGSNQYIGATINIRSGNLNTAASRTSLARLLFDFADVSRWTPAELGGVLHLSGGVPSYWDGARLSEVGFEYRPENLTLTANNSGGAMAAGTYYYVSVYGYVDETGAVHRSAPSSAQSVTVTGAGISHVTVATPCQCVTTRQDAANSFAPEIFIETYRTEVNSAGPFYLIKQGATSNEFALPKNSATSKTVSIDDNTTDAVLVLNRQLYTGLNGTTEAVLENVCPPSSGGLIAHNGCLWSIGDDGNLWYTKARVDGEALAFCDEFTLQWDETTPPTALASLDQNVVVFSKARPYIVQGQTPTDSGIGGSLIGPTRITSDYGCIDARSLVTMPEGLIFQSSACIAKLDRGLNIDPLFGLPLQDTLASYPTLTGAHVHPSGQYVLITAVSNGSTGVRFYYDYTSHVWGIDYLHGTVTANVAPVSEVAVNGVVYWADYDGHVYKEDTTTYLDATSNWVTLLVETPEIKLSGLQGYQRVWKVAATNVYYTAHDLTIKLATDYVATYAQTQTFTAATLLALKSAGTAEQVQVHVVRQLCEAIRVVVQDATPSSGSVGSGRGASFEGLDLELGVMPRLHRLQSSQRS